ncbi:CYTH domain-containing protein [Candidatus Kaiserbacteria bacterium]|nr:CYTH domain-containing protein [Candidatus Kaiserbacteria bacterium]
MNTEIEVKFLHVNHEEIRNRLKGIGFECVTPMRLMRRAIIDYPDRRLQVGVPNSYIRVRDEGDKVTLTYKQFETLSIDGAKEIEVVTSSFEDTIKIFTQVGLEVVSLQESKRETWKSDTCEVVLDEWPWLDPYIEIEASTETEVREVSQQLGLNWSEAKFGDVMVAYRDQYPYLNETQTVGKVSEVLFDSPLPDLLKEKK